MKKSLKQWCLENGEFGALLIKSWTGIEVDKDNNITGNTFSVDDITKGSGKRFKFICNNGHEYFNEISKITYSKRWCSKCNQLKIINNRNKKSIDMTSNIKPEVTKVEVIKKEKKQSSNREKLEGSTIGNFDILEYVGNKQYKCKCRCKNGTIESVYTSTLKNSKFPCCSICRAKVNSELQREHLEGTIAHNWKYIEYLGNSRYLCECLLCHKIYTVDSREIKRGKSKNCKDCAGVAFKNLKGQIFGSYEVIEYAGDHYWKCRCLNCGEIKEVTSQHLTLDNNVQCIKCSNKAKGRQILNANIEALIDKQLHNLVVKGYNYTANRFICECQCKNKTVVEVSRNNLISGNVKSCGCLTKEFRRGTLLERYGDLATKRIGNPRNFEDIEDLMDKDKFINRYNKLAFNLGRTPNSLDIANEFDITTPIALKYAHLYEVDVDIDTRESSRAEQEVINFIKEINDNLCILTHNRTLLQGQELDIYIPEKKLAIEFNGIYWHSDTYVDKYYHQKKTIACAKQGIRLIHIFEHEWVNTDTRYKIENLISNSVGAPRISIRASETAIYTVDNEEAAEFCNSYHLQGYVNSSIRIGLKYRNELVAIMTFGVPRFNNEYEYELIRLCTKAGYIIHGAYSKLFKYFVDNYRPNSVITYCDISKFTGAVYSKLGFYADKKSITEPNYLWVNSKFEVLSRYQTQKHKLINSGLGSEDDTEDCIMANLGYYKIYNSGNLKMIISF